MEGFSCIVLILGIVGRELILVFVFRFLGFGYFDVRLEVGRYSVFVVANSGVRVAR